MAPRRVAIIGGGCGAMTAAFELSRPEHQGAFEITVYQQGWRLGGKGASGRGANGRIEEHGLHVWMGHYDNAFRMMRQTYAELDAAGLGGGYGKWHEAFIADPDIGLFGPAAAGGWEGWRGSFPIRPGLPGDPPESTGPPSLVGYLRGAIAMLEALLLGSSLERRPAPPPPATDPDALVTAMMTLLSRGAFAGAVVLAEALALLRAALGSVPPRFDNVLVRLAEAFAAGLRRWIEDRIIMGDSQRHVWDVVDIMVAGTVGILRGNIMADPRGLDALDEHDMIDWLLANGASPRAVNSPYVQGLYDLSFAHQHGDHKRPRFSAGTGIRGAIRMYFGYRGSLFWRMRAGMGDVVFAPLYDLLRHRGVRFEFFHRLVNVGIPTGAALGEGDRSHVERLDFEVQAHVIGEYDPLGLVAGRRCWPAEPFADQLASPQSGIDYESHWQRPCVGTRHLKVEDDFDFVVLGTSIAAIPHVAPEILARDRRWQAMCANLGTVATQACQLWLDEDIEQLGWRGPPYISTAFSKPFETWCDMAHVVPEEAWPDPKPATAIYLCGILEDPAQPPSDSDADYPQRRTAEVWQSAIQFLATSAATLWPRSHDADGFRWNILSAPTTLVGRARFASQYWRANVNPSDRYVLSLPGTLKYRISPLDMTYDNLTIAGDWTDCGLNSGCTEAAVMSGQLAAHALSGLPRLEDIAAYNHP